MTHSRPRTRVWQTDFSEFETTLGGIWRICAVIDYATVEINRFRQIYDTIRPHQAVRDRTPRDAYLGGS